MCKCAYEFVRQTKTQNSMYNILMQEHINQVHKNGESFYF